MRNIEKAQGQIAIRQVFFAALIFNTPIIETDECPRAATDMKSIFINPAFMNTLDIPLIIFVLLHELMHMVLVHGFREGSREHKLWNIACDHEINLTLKLSGVVIWSGAHCDPRFSGMSAEQIYDILRREQKAKPKPGQGQPGQGQPRQGDDSDNPLDDDLMPTHRMSEADKAETTRQIVNRVASASLQAEQAGKMPAHLKALVTRLLEPQVAWEQALARYMVQFVRDEESWSRRNDRFEDFYLPGRYNQKLGELVIIGDTSGSLHSVKDYYSRISAELVYIVDNLKPERVRVIWADDANCSLQQVFEPGDMIELTPMGGGGTDMRKPLSFVEQYDPLVVVLVTDCETPWPVDTPYPLLVLSTNNKVAPIGETIRITT